MKGLECHPKDLFECGQILGISNFSPSYDTFKETINSARVLRKCLIDFIKNKTATTTHSCPSLKIKKNETLGKGKHDEFVSHWEPAAFLVFTLIYFLENIHWLTEHVPSVCQQAALETKLLAKKNVFLLKITLSWCIFLRQIRIWITIQYCLL